MRTKTISGPNLLMRHKDLEPANDLRKGDTAIILPVLYGLDILDEDDKVIFLALVVDFGLGCVAAGHVDSC